MTRPTRPTVLIIAGGLMTELPDLSSCESLAEMRFATSVEQAGEHLPDADVALVWDYRFSHLASILGNASRLRWVHAASVGVDPLLSPGLRDSSVVLTNSRGVFDDAIAEYVMMLALAHEKDFEVTLRLQAERRWRHRLTGRLGGKRVVVLGAGSIGRAIAARFADLGTTVTLVGRVPRDDPRFGLVEPSTRLARVCEGADYLILAAPLTDGTRHIVGADVLRSLGPAGYLINVARGGLVDTSALISALATTSIAGAALDTFEHEPLDEESPLWSLPNVVVSPHMSGDFAGFDNALVDVFRANLERFVGGRELANVVDLTRGYVPSD